MFFIVELRRNRSRDEFDAWEFWERHQQLFTARSRIANMILARPELRGHFRIIRCVVLEGLDNA